MPAGWIQPRKLRVGKPRLWRIGSSSRVIDPDSPGFDDPQRAGERPALQFTQHAEESRADRRQDRARGTDHDDALRRLRREAKWVGEIQVQGDQGAAFRPSRLVDLLVRTARQPLGWHGLDVMATVGQQRDEADIEVLSSLIFTAS